MRLYKQMSLRDLIDRSINETLARSLYTSVTAFLALLPMAIWGGSAVESFAVPMVFGIVVAASSSVFIAAPILLFLGEWRKRRTAAVVADAPAGAGSLICNPWSGAEKLADAGTPAATRWGSHRHDISARGWPPRYCVGGLATCFEYGEPPQW
jgi:predicted RND superfamily exporter protein